jgi:GNAT superfamily N-acetyltransferase
MKNNCSCVIRKYTSKDRSAVREISHTTALMGEPSAAFFADADVFADALTIYFTDHEPESCFVAECENRVVGYLLGSKDVIRMEKIFTEKITLPLLGKALRRCTLFHAKTLRFLFHVLISAVKGEFTAPGFSQKYPATLHINLRKEYRVGGIGAQLIAAYLGYLKEQKITGVHLATMSDTAATFFEKQNFKRLFHGERTYFRYFLGKNVPLYIYGMHISEQK